MNRLFSRLLVILPCVAFAASNEVGGAASVVPKPTQEQMRDLPMLIARELAARK